MYFSICIYLQCIFVNVHEKWFGPFGGWEWMWYFFYDSRGANAWVWFLLQDNLGGADYC